MPASLVRTHYLLGEAVELLGRHMFGAQWRGGEAWARTIPSVEQARGQRDAKEKRLLDLETLCTSHDAIARLGHNRSSKTNAERKRQAMEIEVQALRNDLATSVSIDEQYRENFDACQRRDAVVRRLLSALESGEIHAIAPGAPSGTTVGSQMALTEGYTTIRDTDWGVRRRKLDADKLAFLCELSLLEPLDGDNYSRPITIRILEAEFDTWLHELEPAGGQPRPEESAEVQCRRWLRQMASTGIKSMTRDGFVEAALKRYPLSERHIRRIWAEKGMVPESWRRAGKPKRRR
jgi:hypothetical protein